MSDGITYTAGDVVGGFAGAVTFSSAAAQAVAAEINKRGDLGSLSPDDAARHVQEAFHEGTGGGRVSIDVALAALTAIHARKASEGVTIGFTDQPGAARGESSADGGATAPAGSGTAAAAGPISAGAGAGADATADAAPTSKTGKPLRGAAAKAATRKRGS
jgi:hypothetical protein